eukprot:COSAG02_NODE_31236_length_537_cov_0.534247_1_plen_87_part_10
MLDNEHVTHFFSYVSIVLSHIQLASEAFRLFYRWPHFGSSFPTERLQLALHVKEAFQRIPFYHVRVTFLFVEQPGNSLLAATRLLK